MSGSNSETVIQCPVERSKRSLKRGMEGGPASLEAHRDAGAALVELKKLLTRGQFGLVAEARCHCCKQWRAPLIKLHQEWNDILSALRWAESCGQAYSVDGKLALLTKWRRAQSGNADPSQGTRARSRSDALLRENALLKERLSARRPIS